MSKSAANRTQSKSLLLALLRCRSFSRRSLKERCQPNAKAKAENLTFPFVDSAKVRTKKGLPPVATTGGNAHNLTLF